MACFPFMADICGKTCLLVGGGKVALRKAQTLAAYGARLVACAETFVPELPPLCARAAEAYSPALLEGADFVVAATDDGAFNARVAKDCRARHIPVNCVDDAENCVFFFPAQILRGGVSVGISTGGASPALAKILREYLERVLPENLAELAENAEKLRKTLPEREYIAAVREEFTAAARGALCRLGEEEGCKR